MKRIALAIMAVAACSSFSLADENVRNAYIKKKAIEPVVKAPVNCPANPFSYLPVDCWKGQKIMFMPMEEHQHYGYQQIYTSLEFAAPHASYENNVGRVGTITKVEDNAPYNHSFFVEITMDDNGEQFYYHNLLEYKSTSNLDDIVFLRDVDDARKMFIGKTLWVGSKKVTIKDVGVSDISWNPVRFITTDKSGKENTYDVSMSATNRSTYLPGDTFESVFSVTDRKILNARKETGYKKTLQEKYRKYHWSKKVWDCIFGKKVFLGMSKLQATLSWGKPERINKTIGGYGVHEQWVYGDSNYLYFENGTLTSIQN